MDTVVQIIINGILLGGVYALVATGLTLIFGVLRIVNFAHGEFLMIGMFLTYQLIQWFGGDPYLWILPVSGMLIIIGYIVYRLCISRILGIKGESQLLITYGLSIFLQNIALFIWGANFRAIDLEYATKSFFVGDIYISYPRLLTLILCVILVLALSFCLKNTSIGKQMRASSVNRAAAELMGINTRFIFIATFCLGIVLTGIAGASMLPYLYVYPTVGASYTLLCFICICLGGLGNTTGAMLGGLFMGLVQSVVATLINGTVPMLFFFLIFIVILLFRPQGLFTKGARLKL